MTVDTSKLRQKYSPDGSPLRELQLLLFEEVKFLDKICKENGLTYFLTGGSALGAVRHQGFIPWDDDMDIALFEDDYKKLVKILLETESDQYVLHCRKTDFNYTFGFPKYRAKEGNFLGCFPQRGILYKYKGYGIGTRSGDSVLFSVSEVKADKFRNASAVINGESVYRPTASFINSETEFAYIGSQSYAENTIKRK